MVDEYKGITLEEKRAEALAAAKQEEINASRVRAERAQTLKEKEDTKQEKQDTNQKREDVKQAKLGLREQLDKWKEQRAEGKAKRDAAKLERLERESKREQLRSIIQERKLSIQSQRLRQKELRAKKFNRSFLGKLSRKASAALNDQREKQPREKMLVGNGAAMRVKRLAPVPDSDKDFKDIMFESTKEFEEKEFKKFKLF